MGWYKFIVSGESMLPLIKPDQMLYVNSNGPKDFKIGDLIVFRKQTYRCHRIIKKYKINGQIVFVTKGDNNSEIDEYLVTLNEIIGRAEVVNPFCGEAACNYLTFDEK